MKNNYAKPLPFIRWKLQSGGRFFSYDPWVLRKICAFWNRCGSRPSFQRWMQCKEYFERGKESSAWMQRGYRKSLDKLMEVKPPCIIHWNFNHFVVYEGYKRDKFYINDPAGVKETEQRRN